MVSDGPSGIQPQFTPRQRAALFDPLTGDDPDAVIRRRVMVDIGDGALLTTILAVDR